MSSSPPAIALTPVRPYREMGRRIVHRWPRLALIGALTTVASFVAALTPWPMKLLADSALGEVPPPGWLVDGLTAVGFGAGPRELVAFSAVATLALILLNALPGLWLSWLWAGTGESLTRDLSIDMLGRQLRAPLNRVFGRGPDEIETSVDAAGGDSIGEAMTRVNQDSYSIYTLANLTLIAPGREILTLISMAGLAWTLSPFLTAVAFTVVPVLVVVAEALGRRVRARSEDKRNLDGRFASMIQRTLASLPVVQVFNLDAPSRDYRRLADEGTELGRREALSQLMFNAINGTVLAVSSGLVLLMGGRRVLDGALTVGALLVFLGYVITIRGSVLSLVGLWRSRQTIDPSVERVGEVLSLVPVGGGRPSGAAGNPEAGEIPDAHGGGLGVVFDGVSFGYRDGVEVLSGLSLSVGIGEFVGVVGPSGSGKSTLLGLVPRLFDPWEGRVLVGGLDVVGVDVEWLRSQVAVVLQEPFLFPVSVAENIGFGRPGVSRAEVEAAAEAAGVLGFVGRLPGGLDSVVGERGATLSGGERQRVAIARALVRDAPVVLLDEPTSALDAGVEGEVLDALAVLVRGRTTLVASHRDSVLERVDRVVDITEFSPRFRKRSSRVAATVGAHLGPAELATAGANVDPIATTMVQPGRRLLEITLGGDVHYFAPDDGPVDVGRRSTAPIHIADPTISRTHLHVSWTSLGWVVKDASFNGCYDQLGARLGSMWLVAGDHRIQIGRPDGPSLRLRALDESSSGAADNGFEIRDEPPPPSWSEFFWPDIDLRDGASTPGEDCQDDGINGDGVNGDGINGDGVNGDGVNQVEENS